MQSKAETSPGEFLLKKSIFLMTSAVGRDSAEAMLTSAITQIGLTPATLTQSDIARVADLIEPALRPFVGGEQARRLGSALRVLVGGVVRG